MDTVASGTFPIGTVVAMTHSANGRHAPRADRQRLQHSTATSCASSSMKSRAGRGADAEGIE
jgi:hypothetical protein